MMRPTRLFLLACLALLVSGCDLLGTESAERLAALREADGKAVGGACRNAGRAIEDCYALNPKVQRPAIFAGWRDMDEYMRENKLEVVAPVLSPLATTVPATTQEPESQPAATAPSAPAAEAGAAAASAPATSRRKPHRA